MKELNIPPFYVGQKVVCIKTHSWKMVIKNNIYTVSSFIKCTKCGIWLVTVGVINSFHGSYCGCKTLMDYEGEMRFNPSIFAPVQENFQSISLEKILEKETSLISAS